VMGLMVVMRPGACEQDQESLHPVVLLQCSIVMAIAIFLLQQNHKVRD